MSQLETDFLQIWNELGPSGYDLVVQYRFEPLMWSDKDGWTKRRWRFDAALPSHWICVELEGIGPAHQQSKGFKNNCEKYTIAASKGWRVLRFVASDVRSRPWWIIEVLEDTIQDVEWSRRAWPVEVATT